MCGGEPRNAIRCAQLQGHRVWLEGEQQAVRRCGILDIVRYLKGMVQHVQAGGGTPVSTGTGRSHLLLFSHPLAAGQMWPGARTRSRVPVSNPFCIAMRGIW